MPFFWSFFVFIIKMFVLPARHVSPQELFKCPVISILLIVLHVNKRLS